MGDWVEGWVIVSSILYGSGRPGWGRDPEGGMGRFREEEVALSGMREARRRWGRPAHCGVRVSLPGERAGPLWRLRIKTEPFRNRATLGPLFLSDVVQVLQNERRDLDPVDLALDRKPVLEVLMWNDRVRMRLLQRTMEGLFATQCGVAGRLRNDPQKLCLDSGLKQELVVQT